MTETRGGGTGDRLAARAIDARGYDAAVRGTTSAAVALVALAVLSSSARADDPPGLALAKRVVEQQRGDEHKAKMRIVWPETIEATPPEGAEVVLIDGYIDYEMTRLVWRGVKVEAGSVSTARSWFYNPKGESYVARTFDVDPKAFAAAWAAALYVAGAKDEPIDPATKLREDGIGGGSHAPQLWTRLRVADNPAPLFFADARSSWGAWNCIRDVAIHECFVPFVPDDEVGPKKGVASEPSTWRAAITDEIRRGAERLDLSYEGEHRLLLEVCLRVGGEVGDAVTLAAIGVLDRTIRLDKHADDAARGRIDTEIGIARTKLGLALGWDSTKAADLIRAGQHQKHWQEDLTKWIRGRFRAQDPTGYAALLVEELDAGGPKYQDDLLARLDEVRELRLSGAAGFARSRLDDKSAAIRVAAARALLALDPKDGAAVATILTAADDAPLVADTGKYRADAHPRIDALNECLDRGLLTPKDVRARLDRAEDPKLIVSLLDVLRRTPSPPTDDEARAAWRRLLNSSRPDSVFAAVSALLDLRDLDARELLVAALDRCLKGVPLRGEQWRQDVVARLRERIAKEMPEPTPPK